MAEMTLVEYTPELDETVNRARSTDLGKSPYPVAPDQSLPATDNRYVAGAFMAVVTTSPTGGVGEGAVQSATVTTSGGIVHSGGTVSLRMPYLDGLN